MATEPTCPICRSASTRRVPGPHDRWRYQRCQLCEHQWLQPLPSPDDLGAFYNAGYAVDRDRYLAKIPRELAVASELVASARPRPGRMLEIGCSYGAVLKGFRDSGWQVDGVELDRRAAAYARETFGLNVIAGTLDAAAPQLSPPYDIVTMYHVIEHIVDPIAFCRQVRTLVADDGMFLVRTPNVTSLAARLTGGWWEWAIAPEHVHLYSPVSLGLLLGQTGFAVRATRTREGDADPTVHEVLRATVRRAFSVRRPPISCANGTAPSEGPYRSRASYLLADRALRVALTPAEWVAARLTGPASGSELMVLSDAAAGRDL